MTIMQDGKVLAGKAMRCSAIALIAAVMPLGLNFSDDGASVSAPAAYAKEGNNGGGNEGNGNGGSGNGNGNGNGVQSAESQGVGPGDKNLHGKTTSALGALNAAHALLNGSPNASANSRVGRVQAAIGPLQDMVDAQATVDALQATISLSQPTDQAYIDAQAALPAALANLAAKTGVAQTSVEAAANKEVDQSVMDALVDLLGLQ